MNEQRSIVIIGGGISGLALGAYIKDGGFNSIIIEKNKTVGGKLKTEVKDGYLLEHGANTCSSNLAFEEMVKILGIEDKVVRPGSNAGKRFILKNNKLKAVSPKPKDILFSPLLSAKGKSALFNERFKKANQNFEEETVGQFFERRFGREVVESLIDPVIAGIYAGDPYQLSMQSVMPKLIELEAQYGSITKAMKQEKDAMPKREVVTFEGGMQTLVDGLVNYIGDENILREMNVKAVEHLENGQFAIALEQEGIGELEIVADVVVFATPSNVTADFIKPISPELAGLMVLHHPKVAVVHLGYDAKAMKKPFKGFGFLVPSKEQKSLLGAIANSSFLQGRAPEGKQLFTLMVGGTRNEQQLMNNRELLINNAIAEFESIMGISQPAEMRHEVYWDSAIPQYTIGHQALLEGIEFFEKNINNLHILGSFRSGLSVGDCIAGAKKAHGQLIKDYSRQSYLASIDKDYLEKQNN